MVMGSTRARHTLADAGIAEASSGAAQRRRPMWTEADSEAVARGKVHVACCVHAQTAAAFPDARRAAVGRGVEDLLQRQVAGPIADDPAVIRTVVAVRSPGDIDVAARQRQCRALALAQRIEARRRAVAAGARTED